MSEKTDQLRAKILEMVAEYSADAFPEKHFEPGKSAVPVSGRVFDAGDVQSLIDSGLDFWLTEGRFAKQFEKEFGAYAMDLKTPLSSADSRRQGFLFFQTPDKRAVRSGHQLTLTIERLPQPASIAIN